MGTLITTNALQIDSLIGFQALSLTNFDSSTASLVSGNVEIAGAKYNFNGDSISTTGLTTGDCYLELVPSGSTVTAQWTNTAGVWSDTKGGFYHPTNTSNRIVGGGVATGTTVDGKFFYEPHVKNGIVTNENDYMNIETQFIPGETVLNQGTSSGSLTSYITFYKPVFVSVLSVFSGTGSITIAVWKDPQAYGIYNHGSTTSSAVGNTKFLFLPPDTYRVITSAGTGSATTTIDLLYVFGCNNYISSEIYSVSP